MRKSLAFTLAEVLITLAIIGVVAAMTIPSVIVNTNQQEFKTGLRKAVSVLNSAITMNNAIEGESPYDNADLFEYLQQHMSILKSTTLLEFRSNTALGGETANKAFYTTDGMRFEIPTAEITKALHDGEAQFKFNESGDGKNLKDNNLGYCGSYGFSADTDTLKHPCLIMVDVNGDRKPNPANKAIGTANYSWPGPGDKLIKDVFPIIITDDKAIPYGVAAQKAMYQSKQ